MSRSRSRCSSRCLLICFACGMVLLVVIILAAVLSQSKEIRAPGEELASLEAEFYSWKQKDSPEFTTSTGVHTYDDIVENYSIASLETRKAKIDDFLRRLSEIQNSSLTRKEGYSYNVFNDTLFTFSSNYKWRKYGPLNPVNFLEGNHIDPSYFVNVMNFKTEEDYEKYLSRLKLLPRKFQQIINRFKVAAENGHTYHEVSVKKVPEQINKILATSPENSVYYEPFTNDLDRLSLSESERSSLRSEGRKVVSDLQRSYIDLRDYIEKEYTPKTRDTYGLLGLPDGAENYRACLKWHISVDLKPEQVHQKGLEEVNRISAEIRKIMKKRNFEGTVAEFYKNLKEQPQFHKNSTEELLREYEHMVFNRIYPQLHRAFKNIPDLNVSVEAMPNDGPAGVYLVGTADGSRQGVFQVNLKRPSETNTFSMMALTLHETIPGHHLQAIYALNATLPDFQRYIQYEKYFAVPYHFPFYTAYTEGWGLYAESLGEYLGLYKDDNELLGRYGEEIFRACRLVIDTGLHHYGWSRNKSIEYMTDHTPMARSDVEIEIDRYITIPGQACAYKIGELKILELRDTAMKELGSQFDIRDFHSQILENGPVPLHLLEQIVSDWIKDVKNHGITGTGNQT